MLRQATVILLAAALLAPAATAGRQKAPPKVVVRTELVPSNDGFDWLDAAAGFGVAVVSLAAALLIRSAKSAS
jgi:hypothetical protein